MVAFDPAIHAPVITTPGNPYIQETDMMDSVALLLSGHAKRCKECKRPARLHFLTDGKCPDCQPGKTVPSG